MSDPSYNGFGCQVAAIVESRNRFCCEYNGTLTMGLVTVIVSIYSNHPRWHFIFNFRMFISVEHIKNALHHKRMQILEHNTVHYPSISHDWTKKKNFCTSHIFQIGMCALVLSLPTQYFGCNPINPESTIVLTSLPCQFGNDSTFFPNAIHMNSISQWWT